MPSKWIPLACCTVVATLTFACASTPEEPSGTAIANAPLLAGMPAQIAGYRHSTVASRFRIGEHTSSLLGVNEMHTRGEHGEVVTHTSGYFLALPNAEAPSTKAAPVRDASRSNAMALEYFVGAGLPQDQVAGTYVTTIMAGGGTPEGPLPETFVGYVSHLRRAIHGVPVVESSAWVRFNDDGTVVMEAVYWPELPGGIQAAVDNFSTMLDEPVLGASFRKKVADVSGNPHGLVIHHALGWENEPLGPIVTFDVERIDGRGKPRLQSFDISGEEVKLRVTSSTEPGSIKEQLRE